MQKRHAYNWLECVVGHRKLHPLTELELQSAFSFFDRDRSSHIHRHDLEESCVELHVDLSSEVQKVLLGCFPQDQINYTHFVRAYEARLSAERMRHMGDLESAFKFLAEDNSDNIPMSKLKDAFREITPVHFSDAEVEAMLKKVLTTKSATTNGEEQVNIHEFCKVVCQANFQHHHGRQHSRESTTKSVTCSYQLFDDRNFQNCTSTVDLDEKLRSFHSFMKASVS